MALEVRVGGSRETTPSHPFPPPRPTAGQRGNGPAATAGWGGAESAAAGAGGGGAPELSPPPPRCSPLLPLRPLPAQLSFV